ncbi:MAG: carbon-nitrogen hydrolase family protein [Firmicutes bacterium]|nr:carbon-nitrogen hydrolase family protein [Bacillota bacterium]
MIRVSVFQLRGHSLSEMDVTENEIEAALADLEKFPCDLAVFPECAFPAYYLAHWNDDAAERSERMKSRVARAARAARSYMVFGVPELAGPAISGRGRHGYGGPRLYNSVFVWGPQGELVTRCRKHFLWHFDSIWFDPGQEFASFDAPWGKVGLIVCADGRVPEVTRMLATRGCTLIANATNWVTSGRNPTMLSNPQAEYLMSVRAAENGVWIAAANKVGREEDLLVFCGRSMVVSPDGEIVVEARPDEPARLDYTILSDHGGTLATPASHRLSLRRPELYVRLTSETPSQRMVAPSQRAMEREPGSAKSTPYVAVVQRMRGIGDMDPQMLPSELADVSRKLQVLGADIAVFSLSNAARPPAAPVIGETDLDGLVRESFTGSGILLMIPWVEQTSGGLRYVMLGYRDGQKTFRHMCLHGEGSAGAGETRTAGDPVSAHGIECVDTDFGPVGIMLDIEGMVPEVARALALSGARLIVWAADGRVAKHREIARARAMENRVFVVCANGAAGTGKPGAELGALPHLPSRPTRGESLICDPDGRIIAEAFSDTDQIVGAFADLPATSRKQIVPGTDAFAGRMPRLYRELTSE